MQVCCLCSPAQPNWICGLSHKIRWECQTWREGNPHPPDSIKVHCSSVLHLWCYNCTTDIYSIHNGKFNPDLIVINKNVIYYTLKSTTPWVKPLQGLDGSTEWLYGGIKSWNMSTLPFLGGWSNSCDPVLIDCIKEMDVLQLQGCLIFFFYIEYCSRKFLSQ